MPSVSKKSSDFRLLHKFCSECGTALILKNSRDIDRKKYCSRTCRSKVTGRNTDMSILWSKGNTPEVNAKKAHHKESHPKWISDRSLIKKRPMPERNEWRDAVFKRDSYACVDCGKIGGKLQAHHKAPYSLFKGLRNDVANGITVCTSCHKKMHKAFSEIFGSLAKNKENHFAI